MRRKGWLAALVLGMGLSSTVAASGGPGAEPRYIDGANCPPSSYSPWHFWAPLWYRFEAYHHCCHPQYLYAADRYPEVPPTYEFSRYPCRAVDPATYYGYTK